MSWKTCLRASVAAAAMSLISGVGTDVRFETTLLVAAEDLSTDAATVEQATKVLDLRTLALPAGATASEGRQLGMLSYEAKGDLKSAFAFQQQQLVKSGWKELPGTQTEATYCTGNFEKSNFIISVTSYDAGDANKGAARISMSNLGNVRLDKLPVMKGAKTVYSGPATASYSTPLKLAEAIEATRKLLLGAGWEPFGSQSNPPDSEVLTFKRNAIRLIAFIGVSPVDKGQTSVMYSASVLSADIPAPPNAEQVDFVDHTKTLHFETSASYDEVGKFYQQRLAKLGWKPTTEDVVKQEDKFRRPTAMQVFRNDAKDILTLDLEPSEEKSRAKLTHLTAAEYTAIEQHAKEAAQRFVAEREAREKESAKQLAQAKKSAQARFKSANDDDGFPDVDSLIKGAVGDALKGGDVDVEKLTKGKIPGAAGAKKTGAPAKDAVSVPLPDGTKKVTQTSDNVLQIKIAGGKGQAFAKSLRDQLLAAGWEADDDTEIDKTSGNVTFKNEGKQLTMSYVDTGFTDVNLMLIGIGTKLEQGKADPNAKVPVASSKPKSKPDTNPSDDDDPLKALKKKAGIKPSKSEDDQDKPKSVKLPKRVEKPIRGIAKLDKLPTEAKVVVNGKPMTLPHVIAYEIASEDRWVTKILASATPIKQASLIELLQKNGEDSQLTSMSPRLLVELDDQDKPINMSYAADRAIGSAGSSGLTGEAIVEEGRARGTFKAKKESVFFGNSIIGEFSFDVPVLTRDSQPAKQLASAKKLETVGNLVINNKPMKLGNVAAYQVKSFDEIRTVILFSEKPINITKLKAALAKDGNDDSYFDFSSQVKVTIDKEDRPAFLSLYADGASINQNTGLVSDVIVEDGRARGTVKLDKAIEFAGKTINFELTFDIDVLPLPESTK